MSRFGPGGPTPLSSRLLPQQVWELEQELTKQKHTISEAKAKVNYLQAQLNQSEKHLQGQKQLEGEMQGKMELVQYSEQQARVALESAQSRVCPAPPRPLMPGPAREAPPRPRPLRPRPAPEARPRP